MAGPYRSTLLSIFSPRFNSLHSAMDDLQENGEPEQQLTPNLNQHGCDPQPLSVNISGAPESHQSNKQKKKAIASVMAKSMISAEITDRNEIYGDPTFKSNLICYYGAEKVIGTMHYFDAMKVGPKLFIKEKVLQRTEKIQQMVGYVCYEKKIRQTKTEQVTTVVQVEILKEIINGFMHVIYDKKIIHFGMYVVKIG
jgi:hypothetical protein